MPYKPTEYQPTGQSQNAADGKKSKRADPAVQISVEEKTDHQTQPVLHCIVCGLTEGFDVITHGENQGRGEKAVFNVKKDTIVLTGNPVLIAKDQGKTEGIKLTFYIADGKIIVENKDRERSVTVIKS